jgi:exonuclease SbcC
VSYSESVVLTLADGTVFERESEVAAKIAGIIGLDRDQFAQIVMIAQNDFLRFLQSGTDERVKILRRIFGTDFLKIFQETLKAKAKSVSDELNLCRHDFERRDVDTYKRNEQFAAWEAQIARDDCELDEIDKKQVEYDRRSAEIAGLSAVAQELSAKFARLEAATASRAELSARADDMKRMETRLERGQTALRRVKPLADRALECEKLLANAEAGLKTAETDAEAARTEHGAAKQALSALPPPGERRAAFDTLKREWEQAASRLAGLNALDASRRDITAWQTALARLQDELTGVTDILAGLAPLAGAEAALDALKEEYDQAEARQKALYALDGDYAGLTKRLSELAALQGEFERLNSGFADADAKRNLAEEAFLRGQAGILARELAAGEPCPVCGSPEHPRPAALADGAVNEGALKKARDEAERARTRREEKAADCSALKTRLDTLYARFIADLHGIVPDASVDTIDGAGALLASSIADANQGAAELARKKTSGEKALSELAKRWDAATKKRDELVPKRAEMKAATDARIERFLADAAGFALPADWDAAGERLAATLASAREASDRLTAQKNADEKALIDLEQRHETATRREAEAALKVQSAQTLAGERKRREQEQRKYRDEAADALASALETCGFADEAEYRASLMTEDGLTAAEKQLADYAASAERLAADIERLGAELSGKQKPDLEKLNGEAAAVNAAIAELREKRDAVKSRLEQTKTVLAELRQSAERYARLEKQYTAVKQLSDAANGRLDFETYAQTAYFERVLRAANLRLRLMSQNRYVLSRKTGSDDGRKRQGLDIEVLDSYTGKARSAGTLSGGESFMASLSLALGLSDVVQQNSGGVRLDAMFIDEGFGSLDPDVLELAVNTLSNMTGAGRIIGIISHVAELRDRIDKQIRVEKTPAGSRVSVV